MISLNVLVVDDSLLMIRKLEAMLSEMGHKVVATAQTGDAAIEKYAKHNPDLVTLDITMPGMNGIDAAHEIVTRFKDARIIMVTSNGLESMVFDALQVGAKGYILKPFEKQKLEEQIARVIK